MSRTWRAPASPYPKPGLWASLSHVLERMIRLISVLHLENGRNTPTSEVGGSGQRVHYLVFTQRSWAFGVSAVGHEGKAGGSCGVFFILGSGLSPSPTAHTDRRPTKCGPRPEFANPRLLSLMEENQFGGLAHLLCPIHGGNVCGPRIFWEPQHRAE